MKHFYHNLRYFVSYILLFSLQFSHAQWESPFFSAPVNSSVIVTYDKGTHIEFNEEITPPFPIADIIYSGSEIPSISDIQGDGTNSTLGITTQLPSPNHWQLVVTIRQDYESGIHLYWFTVKIGDVSNKVYLVIDNIHDNAPVIQSSSKTCVVKENFVGISDDCKFTLEDIDGNVSNLTVSLDAGSGNQGIFSLDTIEVSNKYSNINLIINRPLDYETQDVYIITITAECFLSETPLATSIIIILKVEDVADKPPQWIKLPTMYTMFEKTNASIEVRAIDGDLGINANISYSIFEVSDNLTNHVQVGKSTGIITILEIDRDKTGISSFQITVKAYESNNSSSNIIANITIMLQDLDDHIPIISPSFLKTTIQERRPVTLMFNSPVTVVDYDLGESGSFNIALDSSSNTSWNDAFEVVPSYGYQSLTITIVTKNYTLLDYRDENWRNITLQIIATEIANTSHVGNAILNIGLEAVNDRYPQFNQQVYKVNIFENITKDKYVLTVAATDEDFGDTIMYSINSSALKINSSSGVITIAEYDAFDYERQKIVQEVVQAIDSNGHMSYAQIIINVIDVDDTPPTLTLPNEMLKVNENSPIRTQITTNISATDPDTNASLEFNLIWGENIASKQGVYKNNLNLTDCLRIETEKEPGNSGKWKGIIIVNKPILDYEYFDTLYPTIIVRDLNTEANSPERRAIITIEIEDENDNAPVFKSIPHLSIEENSISNKVIGTITATDADGPLYNNIKYSLKSIGIGSDGLVSIDEITGELKVWKDQGIDCESIPTLMYTVNASDGQLNSTIAINITVIDENDNTPQVLSPNTSMNVIIPEESNTGTFIFNVSGKDLDFSEPYHNITYLINYEDYPELENYFDITPIYGVLSVKLKGSKRLDRDMGIESFPVYLTLRDNYHQFSTINSNFNNTVLTVILSDINDNAPEFPEITGYLFSVKEDVKIDTLLMDTLQATDIDAGENAKISFSLINIYPSSDVKKQPTTNLFRVVTKDDKYVQIYANSDLEGFFGTYTLILKAEDHGTPILNSEHKYQVYIEDINDNAPVFVNYTNFTKIYIKEIQNVGEKVVDNNGNILPPILASDLDAGENAHVSILLLGSGPALTYFSLNTDGNDTFLICMHPLDRDNIYSIQLLIEAKDNGKPPLSSILNITLLVLVTEPTEPQFYQTTWSTQFSENITGLEEEITIPEAYDKNNINKDPSQYQPIYYFIVGSSDNELFLLNSLSHKLRLKKELDYEQKTQYDLSIVATNNKNGPPESPDVSSVLSIKINVEDVNDSPPQFLQHLYTGGIKPSDEIDKVVLIFQAIDPDINDTIRFTINSSIYATDDTLNSHTSSGIIITPQGEIILNFKPQADMKGYFYFNVSAFDSVNHTDSAHVQVYLISNANTVTFTFLNTLDYVNAQQNKIEEIFTSVFVYKGTVDSITKAKDENQQVLQNQTEIRVHFIDTSENLPVNSEVILQQTANIAIINQLRAAFVSISLVLEDLQGEETSTTIDQNCVNQPWILFSVVVALLFGFIIALIGLYMWRTKSLQNRLDRMAAANSSEQQNDFSRNITLSTSNIYENKVNPVHGLALPAYLNDREEMDAYIDEALHGLEEKMDVTSETNQVSTA